jgi:DNA polymerase III subunit delta'
MTLSLWERIGGHEETVALLRQAIAKGPTHAYLFCGPRGVGKSQAALAFAAALSCPQACGVCPSCRAVINQTHPDFHYVQPEGQFILRSQVVRLLKSINLKRGSGSYKAVIIDDAHNLGPEAANALLKTLEEPPDGVVFILVAQGIDRVLSTVASRCRRVLFGSLDSATVGRILERNHGVDPARAELVAKLSGGMVGEAVELATGGLLDYRNEMLSLFSGRTDTGRRLDLAAKLVSSAKSRTAAMKKSHLAELDELAELAGGSTLTALKRQAAARQKREIARVEHASYRQAMGLLASLCRDLLLIAENVDKRWVAHNDLADSCVDGLSWEKARAVLDHIEQARRRLDRNVSPLLTFENLFFALEEIA